MSAKDPTRGVSWGAGWQPPIQGASIRTPMHVLLIGHNEAQDSLRAIACAIRSKGGRASCYLDGDVVRAHRELESADFLLVGLSRASREPNSMAHSREEEILQRAIHLVVRRPCIAVMRDVDGWVSAPYLNKFGLMVRYLFTGEQPFYAGVFGPVIQRAIRDPVAESHVIAEMLCNSVRA